MPEARPLTLTLTDRGFENVTTWLEDDDSDLLPAVLAAPSTPGPAGAAPQRTVTLPADQWVRITEGLYAHARVFGGAWEATAQHCARQIQGAGHGYFLAGEWVDDRDC